MVYFSLFWYKIHKILIYLIISSVASFLMTGKYISVKWREQWRNRNAGAARPDRMTIAQQIPSRLRAATRMTFLGIWFKTWLHDEQSPETLTCKCRERWCLDRSDDQQIRARLRSGAEMTYFTFSAVCAIITSDSLLVHACKDTPWISSWKVWKKWRIKFLLARKVQLERPPRPSLLLKPSCQVKP